MIRNRTTKLAVAAVLSTAVLAGCGTMQAGAALVIGGQRTTDGEIQSQVAEIVGLRAAQGAPSTATAALAQAQVSQLVQLAVLRNVADQLGVTVTPAVANAEKANLVGEARKALPNVGGTDDHVLGVALATLGTQSSGQFDVAPSTIGDFLTTQALVTQVQAAEASKLNVTLDGGAGSQKANAALAPLVAAAVAQLKPVVSPRYGTFDLASTQIVPLAPGWIHTVTAASVAAPTDPTQQQ